MKKYLFLLLIVISCCNPPKKTDMPKPKVINEKVVDEDSLTIEKPIYIEQSMPKMSMPEHIQKPIMSEQPNIEPIIEHNPIKSGKAIPSKIVPLKQKNNKENNGSVFYNIPDTMKCQSSYNITLRITKSKNIIEMSNDMEGTIKTAYIPTTEQMSVRLLDPTKSFDGIDNEANIQRVETDSTQYTEWNWTVIPVKSGSNQLEIEISTIKNGIPKKVVYRDTIIVKSNILADIKFFINNNWQYILSTLILPFILFLYNKRKKKDDK